MIEPARGPQAARRAAAAKGRLREGLTCCFVAGRAVFLDLPADRYFCLEPELEAAFRSWASGKADPGARASLNATGLLEPESDLPGRFAPIAVPHAASSLLDRPVRARPPDLAHALVQLALCARRLNRHGLACSVTRLRRCKARMRPRPDRAGTVPIARAARIAWAHEAAGLLFSSHDKCLLRSLALAAHLVDAGIAADLVIGVQLRPFRAHSWIQLGGIAVNDRVESLRVFTPILVV